MLTRWNRFNQNFFNQNPFSLLNELQHNLGRVLQEWEREAPLWNLESAFSTGWNGPRVDLFDQGENLLFVAEVPGLSEKDIKLSVNAETLTISGERKVDPMEGYAQHLRERSAYKFSRSFAFPCKVDVEKVHAHLQDGVLEIKVAKAPEAKPRQIEVKVS